MRQLMLGFGSEWDQTDSIPFDPEIQEQLVMWMAQAVLAVVEGDRMDEDGGSNDSDSIEEQDSGATPATQSGRVHAPVDRKASP